MAKSKKTAPALPNALQGRKNHPIYMILDFHESDAKELLKAKGDVASEKIKLILPAIARVRRQVEKQDAEGAAVFMYELALKLERAGLSLRGKKRIGFVIDRRWLVSAIRHAMKKRSGANRPALWRFFRVEHNGPGNPLEVEGSGFIGDVFWQTEEVDGCLVFDDGDKGDSVNFDTFKKAVSKIKK